MFTLKQFMLGTILLLIFSCSKSIVSSFEFTDDNSFLLNCPINSGDDYQNLLNMAESDSHKIDIFQEIVSVESVSMVQLLADEETSDILLGRFGCFEEKGRGHLKNMFNPRNNFDYKLGKEFHQDYRSYQNIIDQLFQYSNSYPSYVKALKSIGKSNEGRDLFVIHITDPSNRIGTKPLIWIMAGQHAREWIAPASTMLFIDELLLSSSSQNILKNFEFAVMPLVNPDGYEYSRNTNRLWRKNRNRNGGSGGGVDLNRNWDHRWGEMGKENMAFFKLILFRNIKISGFCDLLWSIPCLRTRSIPHPKIHFIPKESYYRFRYPFLFTIDPSKLRLD